MLREYYRRQGLLDIYDAAKRTNQEGSRGFTIIKGKKHETLSHLNNAEVEKYIDDLNQ